jgi:hypothetical protein
MSTISVSERPGQKDTNDNGPVRRSPSWIACAGATHQVSGGRVNCPQRGMVRARDCVDCHLLVTFASERDPWLACSTSR